MQANFDEIIKNEAFKSLEPEKLEAIKDIAYKIQGKSIPEAFALLNSYQAVLNSGKPIPKKEKELMIAVILSSLDDEPREKFTSALKMVNMMKGGY
ncbi:MAG: hypothetical protein FWE24_01830 [Defluviitaleaceae bacterium]|nr:hypothetical protein [Defluviitaleaceae bacterium]